MWIIFLFMPSLVSVVFYAILASRKGKTVSQKLLGWTLLASAGYFICDALVYFPYSSSIVICAAYMTHSFFSTLLPVMVIMFLWSLHTVREHFSKWLLLLLLVPVISCLLQCSAYLSLGMSEAADYRENGLPTGLTEVEILKYRTFGVMAMNVYRGVFESSMVISGLFMLGSLIVSDFTPRVIGNFISKGGPLRPLHLVSVLFLLILLTSVARIDVFGEDILVSLGFLFQALCLVGIGVIGASFLRQPAVHIKYVHEQPTFDNMPIVVQKLNTKHGAGGNTETTGGTIYDDIESESYRTLNLRDEFIEVMRDQQCYLYPGMGRHSVASILNVQRRSVDHLVRLLYRIHYEDYVKVQRCAYCIRYRDLYPDISDTDLAMECGFPSTSIMRKQMKECKERYDISE